jgi:striatin 1/3/4
VRIIYKHFFPSTSSFRDSARPSTDLEPQLTLRAHTAAISSLVHSPLRRLLYSASLDSTIRIWLLPHPNRTTYAAFEANVGLAHATLVGHTDAVWDLALVRNETTLVSCGAEGSIKVWDVSGNELGGKLKGSWGYNGSESESPGDGPGATSLEAVKTDLRTIAVAFRDAIVKLFDLETGKETGRLNSDISYGGLVILSF